MFLLQTYLDKSVDMLGLCLGNFQLLDIILSSIVAIRGVSIWVFLLKPISDIYCQILPIPIIDPILYVYLICT